MNFNYFDCSNIKNSLVNKELFESLIRLEQTKNYKSILIKKDLIESSLLELKINTIKEYLKLDYIKYINNNFNKKNNTINKNILFIETYKNIKTKLNTIDNLQTYFNLSMINCFTKFKSSNNLEEFGICLSNTYSNINTAKVNLL